MEFNDNYRVVFRTINLYDSEVTDISLIQHNDTMCVFEILGRGRTPFTVEDVILNAVRSDNALIVQETGITAEGNVLTIVLDPRIVDIPGDVTFELVFIDNGITISTYKFGARVKAMVINGQPTAPPASVILDKVALLANTPRLDPDTLTWWQWSNDEQAYVNTGVSAGDIVVDSVFNVNSGNAIANKTVTEKFSDVNDDISALDERVAEVEQNGGSTVDTAFDTNSNNAIANKTVTAEFNSIEKNFNSVPENEKSTLGAELIDGTGWVSDGWTGNFATGFTHTTGMTTPLTKLMSNTGTKIYHVEFTIASPTYDWGLTVTIGGSAPFEIYTGESNPRTYRIAIKSIANGNLLFTPSATFNGTVSGISVREVLSPYAATMAIKDSVGVSSLEIRNVLNSLRNVFFGNNSGMYNHIGYENTGVGAETLKNNVDGFWNSAVGYRALENNIGGSRNTAIGYNTLNANISGQRNAAIGTFALYRNTTGIRNVGIGSDAFFYNTEGSNGVAIGFAALYSNTSGGYNIGIGTTALYNNTTGTRNVAIGALSVRSNITGNSNIGIGMESLYKALGSFNVAVGDQAGYHNTNGQYNAVIGFHAGMGTASAVHNRNAVLGAFAGQGMGDCADNTLVGFNSGSGIRTGNNNIVIGAYADIGADVSNKINIGNTLYGDSQAKNIGIDVISPTARLHLPPGETGSGKAPVKFESGTLTAIPEAGTIEYADGGFYFTNDQLQRSTVATLLDVVDKLVPKVTVSGNPVSIDDVIESTPMNVRVLTSSPVTITVGAGALAADGVYNGYLSYVSGDPITSSSSMRTVYYRCKPDTTYTVSKQAGQRFVVAYTTMLPDTGVIAYGNIQSNTSDSITLTTGSDAVYLVAYVWHTTYDAGVTADEMLATVACTMEGATGYSVIVTPASGVAETAVTAGKGTNVLESSSGNMEVTYYQSLVAYIDSK